VALYNKDYETVVANATEAFNTLGIGKFLEGAEYVSGWRALSNPEAMFEVKFAVAAENIGVNESLQSTFTTIRTLDNLRNANGTLNTTSNTGGWGDLRPNAQFRGLVGVATTGTGSAIAITRGADIRGQLFEVGPGRGAGAGIECIKYLGKTGTLYMDNVPVIRKSEMLLNRAEAYATTGSPVLNEDLARADLNTLRVARGLAEVDGSLSGSDLYEAILLQRRIEFFGEGHRWFDLKRLGRDIPKPVSGVPIAYTDFRILANIPTREIDGNPNLVQNPGY
jgi:starch-binding outer membrane protein, SusD/RagB family